MAPNKATQAQGKAAGAGAETKTSTAPAAPAPKQAAVATPQQAAPKPTRPCACGCGLAVRRWFAQGHDQRVRGMLQRGQTNPTLDAAIKAGLVLTEHVGCGRASAGFRLLAARKPKVASLAA